MFLGTKPAKRPVSRRTKTVELLMAWVIALPLCATYAADRLPVDSLLASRQYDRALTVYQQTAGTSLFLRDYKVAAQLAAYLRKEDIAITWLEKAISREWEWKKYEKLPVFHSLRQTPAWDALRQRYPSIRKSYLSTLNPEASRLVGKLFKKDQRKAFRGMLCFTSRGQDRFAERVFAPHSERQLEAFRQLMDRWSYPGESVIEDPWRAPVILIHHNSISAKYDQRDTLYPALRPRLEAAVRSGWLAPATFTQIDDWYLVVRSEWKDKGYGYLSAPESEEGIRRANALRAGLGLSSLAVQRQLKDVERETNIRLFLP